PRRRGMASGPGGDAGGRDRDGAGSDRDAALIDEDVPHALPGLTPVVRLDTLSANSLPISPGSFFKTSSFRFAAATRSSISLSAPVPSLAMTRATDWLTSRP